MTGRRAVIGLSLLSALFVCAFAAQSASALVTTKSNNTTAFTCVEKDGTTNKDFKDEHCDEAVPSPTGKFEHKVIPLNTTTEIGGTNEKTANGTTTSTPAVLKGTLAGLKVTITCTTVKNNEKNSVVHNVEPVAKQHTFTGFIETEFTNCTVTGLSKCVVSEPIVSKANVHGVEGFKGPKEEEKAMGIEFEGAGAEKLFASITFTDTAEKKCPLKNQTFPVNGTVVGTNGPTAESKQDNKHSGSTLTFQDLTGKVKMQTLTLGPNAAEFTAIATPTMAGVGGKPISMTTTT
jgi:hypothetical protein